MVATVLLALSHNLLYSISLTNISFQSAMASTSHLPLSRSGLINRGNLYTQCWCSLVDILGKEGDYHVEILLILIWMCPYCGDCCR